MPTIAVMSLKGGEGKTTSAIFLSACAHRDGHKTILIDADDRLSAMPWAVAAERVGRPLPFRVVRGEADKLVEQVRQFESEGCTVIMDLAPDRAIIQKGAFIADATIVPMQPSGVSMERFKVTLDMLREIERMKGELDVGVLFTRVDSRANDIAQARELLNDLPVFDQHIRDLKRYKDSFGAFPTYLDEYDAIWKDIVGEDAEGKKEQQHAA